MVMTMVCQVWSTTTQYGVSSRQLLKWARTSSEPWGSSDRRAVCRFQKQKTPPKKGKNKVKRGSWIGGPIHRFQEQNHKRKTKEIRRRQKKYGELGLRTSCNR